MLLGGPLLWPAPNPQAETNVDAQQPDRLEFFEKRIRPVLAERCLPCHSSKLAEPKAGLRLDSKSGVRSGGGGGPVVVPGQPEKSRLIAAIRYQDPHLQMPPGGKLADQQIADITAWVAAGAPDPRGEDVINTPLSKRTIDYNRARRFWAFQPVRDYAPPSVKRGTWPTSSIDHFLLAKLEREGLRPAPPADKRTLLRRVFFDLTGLPPSPKEVEAFLADSSPRAYEKVVERLLASPHYGERWARHWLDVVRFAQTDGHDFDVDKPNAWRYRDYVIRAFNSDFPFNRFVMEQLAGDLLPKDRVQPGYEEPTIGTAFYYLGEVINLPADSGQALSDRIENQIDVIGKAFLGLTIACARCHDHKFDPIPTTDYYALAGFLYGSRPRQTCIDSPERVRQIAAISRQIEEVDRQIEAASPVTKPLQGFATQDPRYITFEDFAGVAFGSWKVTGQAFGPGPHNGWAHSGRHSNKLQGILVSREFVLDKRYIHVRLSGRGQVRLFVDEYANDTRIIRSDGPLVWKRLDAQMGHGNTAYFEIDDLDREQHIAVDHICFSDEKNPPEGATPAPVMHEGSEPDQGVAKLLAQRRELEAQIPLSTFALAAVDGTPANAKVHIRGNHKNPGPEVERRFLTVLAGENQPAVLEGSGRLELARRLTAPSNPLLARVMVNRVWTHHFGAGIVASVDNFGMTGDTPSHPELLDHLASFFVRSGWSIKSLHRKMVLSSAYRMSSRGDPGAEQIDPRNRLVHAMPVRRLEAEAIRDNILAVAGSLDPQLFGPGVTPYVSPSMDGGVAKLQPGPLDGAGRRSIYIQVRRNFLADMFLIFDYPLPTSTIGRRMVSTVATQALALMNGPFIVQQAERWARRIVAEDADRPRRVARMYVQAFARPPTHEETKIALDLVASLERSYSGPYPDAEARAWADLGHVLMQTAEFLFIR